MTTTTTSRRRGPKSNAQKCAEYRQRQGKAISLPFPDGIHRDLEQLMEWHEHEDRREAISTMIRRLREAGPEASAPYLAVDQHQFTPDEALVQRLQVVGARAREDD